MECKRLLGIEGVGNRLKALLMKFFSNFALIVVSVVVIYTDIV